MTATIIPFPQPRDLRGARAVDITRADIPALRLLVGPGFETAIENVVRLNEKREGLR